MKTRLLIVDDELSIQNMLSRHFRYLGYDVATAGNGREALDYLGSHKIDVVITDIMMPVMNGIELVKCLAADYPLIRKIVVTGYVTVGNAMECMQSGADALIPKPLEDMAALERSVERSVGIIREWVAQLKELSRGLGGTTQIRMPRGKYEQRGDQS